MKTLLNEEHSITIEIENKWYTIDKTTGEIVETPIYTNEKGEEITNGEDNVNCGLCKYRYINSCTEPCLSCCNLYSYTSTNNWESK